MPKVAHAVETGAVFMGRSIGSLFSVSVIGWVVVNAHPAVAQQSQTNARWGITQSVSEVGATAAAADGMRLLARLMEQNGYDRQQVWIAFYQSSEGHRIMRVPGALSLLTDWFNATMALSSRPQPPVASGRADPEPQGKSSQPAEQTGGEVAGTLTPPYLGPYRPNAYGQGINSDATGRPFVWRPDQGPTDPLAEVRPDVFGAGIGMDQYGRPVRAACPPYQPDC